MTVLKQVLSIAQTFLARHVVTVPIANKANRAIETIGSLATALMLLTATIQNVRALTTQL